MHGLRVYVKSNLLIARGTILEDEKRVLNLFSFGSSRFYYFHIFLVSFAIFVILFCG